MPKYSRDPKQYSITITKRVDTEFGENSLNGEVVNVDQDKTFIITSKSGDLDRRYSVESAPQWIMRIYNYWIK